MDYLPGYRDQSATQWLLALLLCLPKFRFFPKPYLAIRASYFIQIPKSLFVKEEQ